MREFGCNRVDAEVERRWVRGKNSPFSSRSVAVESRFPGCTLDGGLLLVRELDEQLGLGELIERNLTDSRGKDRGGAWT
jgi:hypothetical protein